MKYKNYLFKNTYSLEGKLVCFIGTGSIGSKAIEYLVYLKASIIICVRNIKKGIALKEELLKKYNDAKIEVEQVDISSIESIDNFIENINKYDKFDFLINNAGILKNKETLSNEGFEIHFATNILGPVYLANRIKNRMNKNSKMLFLGSISYNMTKLYIDDLEGYNLKNGIKRYGHTKRLLTLSVLKLKEEFKKDDIHVEIVHPGVCGTTLFKSNKFFRYFIVPLMKVVFHGSEKASLSIIKGLFLNTPFGYWIGPRGLFGIWGYPKGRRLCNGVLDNDIYTIVYNKIIGLIESKRKMN